MALSWSTKTLTRNTKHTRNNKKQNVITKQKKKDTKSVGYILEKQEETETAATVSKAPDA